MGLIPHDGTGCHRQDLRTGRAPADRGPPQRQARRRLRRERRQGQRHLHEPRRGGRGRSQHHGDPHRVQGPSGMPCRTSSAARAPRRRSCGSGGTARPRLVLGGVLSTKTPPGRSSRRPPRPAHSLVRGAAVNIVVSKGRQLHFRHRPHRPASADRAVAALTDAATVDATKQEFSTTVPKGKVISHPRDRHALPGRQGGPRGLQGAGDGQGPERAGQAGRRGTQDPEAAGFKVKVENFMGGIFGTVRTQSPAAEAEAPKGSKPPWSSSDPPPPQPPSRRPERPCP